LCAPPRLATLPPSAPPRRRSCSESARYWAPRVRSIAQAERARLRGRPPAESIGAAGRSWIPASAGPPAHPVGAPACATRRAALRARARRPLGRDDRRACAGQRLLRSDHWRVRTVRANGHSPRLLALRRPRPARSPSCSFPSRTPASGRSSLYLPQKQKPSPARRRAGPGCCVSAPRSHRHAATPTPRRGSAGPPPWAETVAGAAHHRRQTARA
jgi:hypothetical protein